MSPVDIVRLQRRVRLRLWIRRLLRVEATRWAT